MAAPVTVPQPADLLIVTGTSWSSKLIEIGAILRGRDAASHVAMMHHWDKQHIVPWGIEGRPGGVGWVDVTRYLRDPRTVTNAAQPRTPAQRQALCDLGVKLLGTPYDWVGGIAADGAEAIHLEEFAKALDDLQLWLPAGPDKDLPGHVVCSSTWAWGHDRLGLAAPRLKAEWERTTPADWRTFIEQRHWAAV